MLCCLLATALISSVPAHAQEPDAAAAAREQPAETEENDGKAQAQAEREPSPEELTPDTFDPTEKVSEDLPVAFPVDI